MSRGTSRLILFGALSSFLLLGAVQALGQNADPNSGGPSKNDFRLRVVEPVEGSTVTGSSVRVTVANALPQVLGNSSRTSDMPNPSYRVYLGNTLKGELKRDETVLTIDNVNVGAQKLVVEALNTSGEVIGRKEVRFQTVANAPEQQPAAASSTYSSTTSSTATTTNPPPPVAEAAPAPAPVPAASEPSALPQTASSAPRTGLAGLGLIFVGLLAARTRKARTVEAPIPNSSRG